MAQENSQPALEEETQVEEEEVIFSKGEKEAARYIPPGKGDAANEDKSDETA